MSQSLVPTVYRDAQAVFNGEKFSQDKQSGFVFCVLESGVLSKAQVAAAMGIQECQVRKACQKGNGIRPKDLRAVAEAVLETRQYAMA